MNFSSGGREIRLVADNRKVRPVRRAAAGPPHLHRAEGGAGEV